MPSRSVRSLSGAGLAACLGAAAIAPAVAQICDGISETAGPPLTTVRVASGLLRPLFVTAPPGDTRRLFIVLQDGTIRVVLDGALLPGSFLNVASLTRSPADGGGNEEGLLGLAFHPDFASNRRFFVYHTDATGANNVVAEYAASALDPNVADPASRQVVLTLAHPTNANHNGGMLAFGPGDGYLYIGTGDGGGSCDPSNNAQSGTSNLGKLLRIDVTSLPYAIPPDNPFAGAGGNNDEIWALGLRNPWRYSFDRLNADLYIGDVGQREWEEIDHRPGGSPGGDNYGWDRYEGMHCPNPSCTGGGSCSIANNVLPVVEYPHTGGACSVTGGYVYRGCRMLGLRGTYFYADFCVAFIESFQMVGGIVTGEVDRTSELAPGGGLAIGLITSFGEDARGEIYIVDQGSTMGVAVGEVFKIVPVLTNMEVSGAGADPFVAADDPNLPWTWEDIFLTSSHPITAYRVYRSSVGGGGPFDCVHEGPGNAWPGGDPAVPALQAAFLYVVTATNAQGQETSPGTGSGGAPRTLSGVPCPP